MERPRLALIVILCVLLFSETYEEEVEMKVRAGDNITLYCDRSATLGSFIVWIRNCSHENQPSLIMDYRKVDVEIFQRFSFIHNPYNNSYDLHITNISVSDLGLYYCVEEQNKLHDEKGILYSSKVYYYGNRTSRLSLAESASPDCVLCWTLLFSVCPVCVLLSSLLSSICVFYFCRAQTTGSDWSAEILIADVIKGDLMEKHQCEMSKTGKICLHTEVSYRLLRSAHPYAKM